MNNDIKLIVEESAKILRDYPHLKYYEAIIIAKKIMKEKEPIAGKQNRSFEK